MGAGPGRAPIFVVGAPRNGTTLLQALLGAHPRIAAPPEMHFFSRVWAHREALGDLADDAVLRAVVEMIVLPGWPPYDECGWDVETLVARCAGGPRDYAAVFDVVLTDFMARHGKARWCEKTPRQRPATIWRAFPDAQCVHIVRDPRDAAASSRSRPGHYRGAATIARSWRDFTAGAIADGAQRGAGHYLRLRYEDLAADPEAQLRGVFAFLGEVHDPTVVGDPRRRAATVPGALRPMHGRALEPVTTSAVGRWLAELPRREQLRMAPIVAPLLGELGYETPAGATVLAGRGLNALHAPGERVRQRRARRAAAARTPQERLAAAQRDTAQWAQRFDAWGTTAPAADGTLRRS